MYSAVCFDAKMLIAKNSLLGHMYSVESGWGENSVSLLVKT